MAWETTDNIPYDPDVWHEIWKRNQLRFRAGEYPPHFTAHPTQKAREAAVDLELSVINSGSLIPYCPCGEDGGFEMTFFNFSGESFKVSISPTGEIFPEVPFSSEGLIEFLKAFCSRGAVAKTS